VARRAGQPGDIERQAELVVPEHQAGHPLQLDRVHVGGEGPRAVTAATAGLTWALWVTAR